MTKADLFKIQKWEDLEAANYGRLGFAQSGGARHVWDAEKRQAVGLPEADAIIDPKPATTEYLPR